ncbi:MAG: hypothetical protein JSU85_00760 [Candidatus Zixiibacteriota bacterium]|nr:MAG: hypothetical protein JSU85_00760 [candidate division Zixibacteria bacterium]
MPEGYRTPYRKSPIVLAMFFLAIAVFGVQTSLSDPPIGTFYYPPGNVPPGPPPNYNQVDSSYFLGTPVIPMPPPDSGGVYIWVDSAGWNIGNHIYSEGFSLEQFHGSVLALLDSPPSPGVNVFADGFEIFGDTTANSCYLQNDRWGWYQWSENLYEIWWDVSTREWKQGSGDPNDFMVINIAGCAIDFNVWSSGHGGTPFDTDQIYLGGSMVSLSSVPGFVDTYPGVYDPYQSQAGPDPTTDPNITVFAGISGNGASYNKDGLIVSGKTYPCGQVLGEDYGNRFTGPFVYEGNGVQFSSSCLGDPCASNNPPVASSPADTSFFVCEPDEICLAGFTCSDPDNNLLSVEVTGGSLSGDTVCFDPVEGANTITLICTDECGVSDTAITVVTVDLNETPVANSPNDTAMFVCDLSPVCISGFIYSDADGNISSVDITGGTLSRDTVCFAPVEGANAITMIVTDACGEADTAITVVTVDLNEPPVANSPNDTTMFACGLNQICISGFAYSDADGNISSVDVTGGTLSGDQVCFDPVIGRNTITLIVTDSCGESDTAITVVNAAINTPPYASGPNDTTMFLCQLDQICLPGFDYGDSDNNIASVDVVGGILTGDSICFTPGAGANTISLIVTDECGAADTATAVVTVDLNTPPSASCPGDTGVFFACEVSEICVGPFSSSDVDGNIDSAYVITDGFSGTFDGTMFCFMPNLHTVYRVQYVAVDLCGAADTCAVDINVQMTNEPPTVRCPGDTSMMVCDLRDICIPGFGYGDVNNNIATVEVSDGTYDNGNVCFTPVAGTNTIALTVTDSCGLFATCTTTVTISLNSPPIITCINDTTLVVDDLSDICLGGIEIADPDNNIASLDITGGFMIGNEVCFTPVPGINAITVVATDECGQADTCAFIVTIGYCAYLPGDANADFNINGLDITIMVSFFKGGPPLPDTCDCRPDVGIYPFFGAGDTNGNCAFNGLDVTYLYNYLAYVVDVILYCPSCPPTGGWVASEENGRIPVTAKFKKGEKIEYQGIGKR